jgi:WD40 repeat protein
MVKLWDAMSGHKAITFKGRNVQTFTLAFSPDGNRLAAAGTDGKNGVINIWDATPLEPGKE